MADTTTAGVGSSPAPAPIHVDTMTAAVAVAVRPATIRSWANRGRIARHGQDHKGRTMYDLQEVMDAAQKSV
ncbi:hypothetical protein NYO98_10570 [Nocardioides sp. STR2]|uniref:Helix-turn-helix domain-containing protein n=1 Tax=Nocardioides pini TaxID=2975053 RepID=A0ABT4CCN2_9ACTN|nr:hypothetical protein [Nocardioides pini]MCY4726722.1 hypothetical protein [Nocardioides pini]